MATFRVHIGAGNGYTSQEVYVDSVKTVNDARARTKALYPGAKIRGASKIDELNESDREAQNEREERRAEENQAFRDRIEGQYATQNEHAKGGSSAETYNTSTGNSVSNFVDRTGTSMGIVLLAVAGVGIWFAWMLLPLVTLGGGLFAGYKYSSKYSQNVNFHLRMWLVLGSAILAATGGYMVGDKVHEFAGMSTMSNTEQIQNTQ